MTAQQTSVRGHDPLCAEGQWRGVRYDADQCPVCRLIEIVREDERLHMELTHAAIHRAAGVQAARDAVEAWFVANRDDMTWPDAQTAIDALRGEA